MHIVIHQGHLHKVLQEIFVNKKVINNARKEGVLWNDKTDDGWSYEVDCLLLDLGLAFEFQDSYHYITTWYHQNSLDIVQRKDNEKSEKLRKLGITLVYIPCWWLGDKESILSTAQFFRPDLELENDGTNDPIALNISKEYFKRKSIPGVGEPMLASFPSVPNFTKTISPQNSWWMGEKYDGIRFLWNPEDETLYSRAGHELEVSPLVHSRIPRSLFLDGEIWFGHSQYSDSLRAIWGNWDHESCASVRLVVFDDPSMEMRDCFFETRYARLLSVPASHPIVIPASRMICSNKLLLKRALRHVLEDGGEGVILRAPLSPYLPGRTDSLVKLKLSTGDGEALVVAISEGNYVIQLPTGSFMEVPFNDVKFRLAPKVGDIVTIEYDRLSRREQPVNLQISRIRQDKNWEQVQADYLVEQHHYKQDNPDIFDTVASVDLKPQNHWTTKEGVNSRKFLEQYAKSRNFDPLVPENWYKVQKKDFLKLQGLLKTFKGGYVKALLYLFPNIGLDESKFVSEQKKFWKDLKNRQSFFIEFAKRNDFDPSDPANWYSVSPTLLYNTENAQKALRAYNGDLARALLHVFPDIGLDHSMLRFGPNPTSLGPNYSAAGPKEKPAVSAVHHSKKTIWSARLAPRPLLIKNERSTALHKKFFDAFATKNNRDPMSPSSWYSVNYDQIAQAGGNSMLNQYYGGSLTKALRTVYPQTAFQLEKFTVVPRAHWDDKNNHAEFFKNFAASKGFDFRTAEKWYLISNGEILQTKGGTSVLKHYENSTAKALISLFPDIGLDASKFSKAPQKYWENKANRLKFFNTVARLQGFNPLSVSNWKATTVRSLYKFKGGRTVLGYYKNSLAKAISDLYGT
eukprot:Phypoly_transcript_02374.p1 GENE.Phypoly_transcript_02374~~Phypoly_transcript_02374.p1  ORF type:complete len:856 (+),score=113.95 Phypoly_transcript_02374:207-2774(+)